MGKGSVRIKDKMLQEQFMSHTFKSSQSLRETVLVKNFVNFYPPLVVHLVDVNITSGSQLGVVLVKHLGLVNDLSID